MNLKIKNLPTTNYQLPTKESGFTLVELIIVVAIMLLVTAAVAPVYNNLQTTSQLNETTSQVVQFLRLGRERSVDRFNNAKHGVKFQVDRYTLYQGTSYAARNTAYDREVILADPLSISTSLTNDEINFSRGLGEPNNTGSVTINHDIEGFKTIIINEYGAVTE